MAAVRLPALQVVITRGGQVVRFNGAGSTDGADQISWENAVNGGHVSATFRIAKSVYTANTSALRYGARCEINVAPGEPSAGQTIFTGYLLSPATPPTPDIVLEAVGYQQLVRERSDPMLWMDAHAGSWVSTNGDPFSSGFACSSSIAETASKSHIGFSTPQAQQIEIGDESALAWYFGNDVVVSRLAGTINKKVPAPGTAAAPNWRLRHRRYDGPSLHGTQVNVTDLTSYLYTNNKEDTFVSTPSVSAPVTTLELTRQAGASTIANPWRVWINDIRVNGDAYRGGRSPADTYAAHKPILDMAADLGFSTGKVATETLDCLPLWHQSGPWADVFDHLAHLLSGSSGYKWGIWDWVSGAPEVEFRDGATGNTTWTTNAYGSTATAVADINSSHQDLYSKVIVTYRHAGSGRLLRKTSAISPNPFAGLDPPISSRQRAYHYHLRDPQRSGANLPQLVADRIALDYSSEQFDGTVELSYANDGSSDKSAFLIRAGQRLTIADFPGGARTFRIAEVDGDDVGPVRLTIGRRSRRIERLIWAHHERLRHRGLHHIHA